MTTIENLSIKYDEWKEWKGYRNRLANLHLLVGRANASKQDMPLISYVDDMTQEQRNIFYQQSFIRPSISLEFDNFGMFYNERKKILEENLRKILG